MASTADSDSRPNSAVKSSLAAEKTNSKNAALKSPAVEKSDSKNPTNEGAARSDSGRTPAKVDSERNERPKRDGSRDADKSRPHPARRSGSRDRRNLNGARRRSRSPGSDRGRVSKDYRHRGRYSPRPTPPPRSPRSGDHWRGRGGRRSSSMSDDDRHYRPTSTRHSPRDHRRNTPDRESSRDRGYDRDRNGRERYRDYRDRRDERRQSTPRRDRSRSPAARSPPPSNEDDRDRRTVFVQQLANRLKESQLRSFFEENVGTVQEATIVKDRVSGRSKGVGYVEFEGEESVTRALDMTGQRLLGVPIIVQQSEAEKNRLAKATANTSSSATTPFHRLYVGNVHFSVSEDDLRHVFESYGNVEYVSLQRDDTGRSRGYGFVQYSDPKCAKEALDKMNGFDLAGRALRVGLGNDKNHDAAQARVGPQGQASAFSGAGGRGIHAGGNHNYERALHRETEKVGGASALDDTDVASLNHHSFDRYQLMQKLAREQDPASTSRAGKQATSGPRASKAPQLSAEPSRCLRLGNCFNPEQYVTPRRSAKRGSS